MELNEMARQSHEMAKEKGWWDPGTEKTALECHMLIVSEVAEATEEVRKGMSAFYVEDEDAGQRHFYRPGQPKDFVTQLADVERDHPGLKPEGEAVELADAVIRIGDWFHRHGWDLEAVIKAKMAYNATRPHRHGGKIK